MTADLGSLASRLRNVKWNGDSDFVASCPVPGHGKGRGDVHPSLSVSHGNGRGPVAKCHTGCDQRDVFAELKRLAPDAFPVRDTSRKPAPAKASRTLGKITRYEIRDASGNLVAIHVREDRADGKKIWWEMPDGTPKLIGLKLADLPLYGIERLAAADPSAPIIITEGEKATDALTSNSILAVGTVTGAGGTPGDEALRPLLGHPVFLWPDNDKAGREHMARIGAALHRLGHRDIYAIDWKGAPDKGDAADLFALEGARDEYDVLIEEAKNIGTAEEPVPLFTRRASDVTAQPIEWVWDQRLPLGKLVTTAGEPGLGKSRIALSIASTMSKGGYWPQGEGRCSRGEVLILNFEDDQADTTVPRLMAEGADLSLIHFLVAVPDERGARSFDLSRDTDRLSSFLDQHPLVRLIIIDPITACMMGVDSHKNAEVRSALHPLAEVAQRHRVCVLAITHLNKGSGMKAMHRVTGSIAFTAAARVVFLVSKDDADPDGKRNLFLPIKNNLGNDRTGLSFRTEVVRITPEIEAPKILWGDTVTVTADDALTPPDEGKGALKDATAFLSSLLADGPLPADQVYEDAKDAGVGVRALKTAKLKLGVQSRKAGMEGGWEWLLP